MIEIIFYAMETLDTVPTILFFRPVGILISLFFMLIKNLSYTVVIRT